VCGNGYSQPATDYFRRTDWTYVHTAGRNGTAPVPGGSMVWPWAGQTVLRSGYTLDDTWSWFQLGPYGSSGHAHRAKLSLVVRKNGVMLLADSGRFAYQGDTLSHTLHIDYASLTHAHNTLTLDGKEQLNQPAVATSPLHNSTWSLTADVDCVHGNMSLYDGLTGTATHTRSVVFVKRDKTEWFVVVDVVDSDRERSVQATWHTHPNATTKLLDKTAVITGADVKTGRAVNMDVAVVAADTGKTGGVTWRTPTVVRGAGPNTDNTTWTYQGWYSAHYLDASPADTVVYDADVPKGRTVFAWVLLPDTQGRGSMLTATVLSVESESVTVQVNGARGDDDNWVVEAPLVGNNVKVSKV